MKFPNRRLINSYRTQSAERAQRAGQQHFLGYVAEAEPVEEHRIAEQLIAGDWTETTTSLLIAVHHHLLAQSVSQFCANHISGRKLSAA